MIYCLVFANTFLVGCQIFILFVGLWWTPYILEYLYEIDFFNLLFISLPLVYYTSNIEGGLGKQTVYSSWAVWRIIAVALLIGILVAAVNFAWIIRDTRIFDLSMATYTGGIVAGNAFIGITILYEPNITKCVRIVSLILLALEIGLYSISLLIENNVNRLNQYVTVAMYLLPLTQPHKKQILPDAVPSNLHPDDRPADLHVLDAVAVVQLDHRRHRQKLAKAQQISKVPTDPDGEGPDHKACVVILYTNTICRYTAVSQPGTRSCCTTRL